MTADQFERLKAELESSYQGAKHAGRPLLLEGGLDWKALSLSPKDMDFIEAKNAAAREIALALGVPPMLLGIPGDNTYSNYQEAQRAFWRQTVLPLVNRTAKAFSAWLSPAWEVLPEAGQQRLELKPDLDEVAALTSEREALWARLNAASFLTIDEKRAAVGYGAVDEVSDALPAPASGGTDQTPLLKYSPDQPRVPSGNSDGGQWTDGGGGGLSNDPRVLSDATPDPLLPGVGVSQAEPPGRYVVDLRQEESDYGGHTIKHHVARPDAEILDVVRRDVYRGLFYTVARISQGTFLSLGDASYFVNATLSQNRARVDAVAKGLVLDDEIDMRFGSVTGKEAFRPDADADPTIRPTYGVRVRIQTDKRSTRGYRVFSAYPINQQAVRR